MEKSDAQILLIRVGFVPVTNTRSINVGGNLRPTTVTQKIAMITTDHFAHATSADAFTPTLAL
jgi:hypothetical protein